MCIQQIENAAVLFGIEFAGEPAIRTDEAIVVGFGQSARIGLMVRPIYITEVVGNDISRKRRGENDALEKKLVRTVGPAEEFLQFGMSVGVLDDIAGTGSAECPPGGTFVDGWKGVGAISR